MKKIEECTVGILGLGIMGGALAMALRRAGPARIIACDTDTAPLALALEDGVIDEGFSGATEMLARADIVFLCVNPRPLLAFMEAHRDDFRPGALLTDITGVKGAIVAAMETGLRADLDFIPGHPMAGSERGGYAQAAKCDFAGKNYILTTLKRNRPENLEYLQNLIYRLGFARITITTAEDHDRKIAFTSQLCHVIAAALIDCEADTAITRFGGGSFEDLTRIAMLNVPMWTGLFLENSRELLARIAQFEGSLDALKALIAGGEEAPLARRLAVARDRRALMAG
jgi:prephenate dehydrogenase